MKKIVLILVLMLFTGNAFASEVGNLPAGAALQKLQMGNDRFARMDLKHPNINKDRREQLVTGQHPFVAVLSCSDSRVPTEIIFDQGLGDIFVIRNAGNVLDEHVMGSVEYAIEHLGINLVVVLGHESCGAVGAAMKEEKLSPAIESIKKSIEPAICLCKKENKYTYDEVIKTNAKLVQEKILENKDLCEAIKKRGIKIVPAYYNLSNGKVEILK